VARLIEEDEWNQFQGMPGRGFQMRNLDAGRVGLWQADLRQSHLSNSHLDSTSFHAARLDSAFWDLLSIRDCNLGRATMAGMTMFVCDARRSTLGYLDNTLFFGMRLMDGQAQPSFEPIDAQGSRLVLCDLRGFDFGQINLAGVSFLGCLLSSASLTEATGVGDARFVGCVTVDGGGPISGVYPDLTGRVASAFDALTPGGVGEQEGLRQVVVVLRAFEGVWDTVLGQEESDALADLVNEVLEENVVRRIDAAYERS
jgi:hypothetical protein